VFFSAFLPKSIRYSVVSVGISTKQSVVKALLIRYKRYLKINLFILKTFYIFAEVKALVDAI
jgi:hypothetical protein